MAGEEGGYRDRRTAGGGRSVPSWTLAACVRRAGDRCTSKGTTTEPFDLNKTEVNMDSSPLMGPCMPHLSSSSITG